MQLDNADGWVRAARLLLCATLPGVVVLFGGGPAHAETPAQKSAPLIRPADDGPPLPVWDVTAVLGWRGVRMLTDGTYERFDNRALASAILGHHWTPHVKTEVELAATTTGGFFSYDPADVDVSGRPVPLYTPTSHDIQETVLSLVTLYQFGVDAWFHPHIGAGVEAGRTRDVAMQQAMSYSAGNGPDASRIEVPARTTVSTTTAVRGLVTAGLKSYVTPRLFVRTDLRLAVGRAPTAWSTRVGIGVDF